MNIQTADDSSARRAGQQGDVDPAAVENNNNDTTWTSSTTSWPPLECNPEAFSELARKWGLRPECAFVDVLGLEPELLAMVPRPVHAVIVLFPTDCAELERFRREELPAHVDYDWDEVFYMHQHIGNACGTWALGHALLNTMQEKDLLDMSSPLRALRAAAAARTFLSNENKVLQENDPEKKIADDVLRPLDGPPGGGPLSLEEEKNVVAAARGRAFGGNAAVRDGHHAVACDESLNQTDWDIRTSAGNNKPVYEHFTTFVPERNYKLRKATATSQRDEADVDANAIKSLRPDHLLDVGEKDAKEIRPEPPEFFALELDGRMRKVVRHTLWSSRVNCDAGAVGTGDHAGNGSLQQPSPRQIRGESHDSAALPPPGDFDFLSSVAKLIEKNFFKVAGPSQNNFAILALTGGTTAPASCSG
ncbi:unnamed protein product [Amoebophrya sp. A120]|nr:unnamed protein product [Amoebophrya sp. A120]|eukprot:GSA120T00000193001.1